MLKPLGDRVIVKNLAADDKSAGGIILPDTAKERPQRGEVIAVGPGKMLDDGKIAPIEVKVGDIVLFSKYGGSEVKVDGEEYNIMRQDDILGIVD